MESAPARRVPTVNVQAVHHRGCTALEKLSMAHNEVAELGGSLAGLPSLQELRVGHNELTRCAPGSDTGACLGCLPASNARQRRAGQRRQKDVRCVPVASPAQKCLTHWLGGHE